MQSPFATTTLAPFMFLVALFMLLSSISAYFLTLDANETVCYYIDVTDTNRRYSLQFSNEAVDKSNPKSSQLVASISGTKGDLIKSGITPGTVPIPITSNGRYTYCFHNGNPASSTEISFSLFGTDIASDAGKIRNAGQGRLDGLLRELLSSLRFISSTQDFIEEHVKRHSSIAHSSKGLVVFWHILQIGLVSVVVYCQITFLKRIFEKPVKSV